MKGTVFKNKQAYLFLRCCSHQLGIRAEGVLQDV